MSRASCHPLRALVGALAALALTAPAASAGTLKAGAAKVDASWHVGSAAGQYASGCEESLEGGGVDNCPVVGVHGVDPAGHSVHRAPAYGVQSRLSARAIVVEGPGGNRWALVKNDLYIPQDLLWRRTAQILQAEGSKVGQKNLTMAVSHNHSSPFHSSISWGVWAFQDAFDARFFEYYAQRMAQAVLEAERTLVPVRVGTAVGTFDKTHKHSFGPAIADDGTPAGYPQSDTDKDLTVIRFDDISNASRPKPLALILNWSGHPEFLNGNNLISGDYQAPLERIVDRTTGALTIFTQGAVGTAEPERSNYHSIHERLEFNHREYGQADYGASLLGAEAVRIWRAIEKRNPDVRKHIPFRSDFATDEMKFEDRWFGGPISHPTPGVSNCRTDQTLQGRIGIPILGLPDCERGYTDARPVFGPLQETTGLAPGMFKEAGVPVPDNYYAPSYSGLQEDMDIHLQALRIGDLLVTFCSCEQWKDQSENIETRTDKIGGNEYLGFDWSKRCTRRGDGRWDCPNPHNESALLPPIEDRLYQRMKAQVNNDAAGWNDPENAATAESEPDDPAQIKGNFTHDDSASDAAKYGYEITVPVGMTNDYNGYIASYREFQRGDHYRKALTGFGPHSMDYMATRLVQMGRRLKGSTVDPEDLGDKALAGKAVVNQAHNEGRAQAMGALGQAALAAWGEIMPASAPPAAQSQPASIERFDATFFTWTGGDNFTDQPVVRVQRRLGNRWRDFADQSGEVQTTFQFPAGSELGNLLMKYFEGTKNWTWTATFEAFASYFDTGGVRATPPGTYRFVVDGLSRTGEGTKPYHLESAAFEVKPWSGIKVEDLRREADGTMSFRTGPRSSVTSYDIATTEDLREKSQSEPHKLNPRRLELGPIDYPDTYDDPQRAKFIYHVNSYRAAAGDPDIETYCFTCSFRPWADTGEAVAAAFTVLRADGSTERLEAVRSGERFVTPRPIADGEAAFVAAGDVCDGWGNYNGEAALPAGTTLPAGVSGSGRFCEEQEPQRPDSDTRAPKTTIDAVASEAPAENTPFAVTEPNLLAEPGGSVLGARATSADECLPARLAVSARGIGGARLGMRAAAIQSALGAKGERAGRTLAYCVRGGGLLVTVFGPRGDARLIVSTARGHEGARRAGPGDSKRLIQRAYPRSRRSGGRLFVAARRSQIMFALGSKGARYVAVADRRILGRRTTLRGYLGQAGFLR